MIVKFHQCTHCGVKYEYQHSGFRSVPQLCSNDYCEECQVAIDNALKRIPVKVCWAWLDASHELITVPDIEQAVKARHDKAIADGVLACVRVFAGLYKTNDSTNNGEIEINGELYRYGYWRKTKEPEYLRRRYKFDKSTDMLKALKGDEFKYDKVAHGKMRQDKIYVNNSL